jgi:LPS-assembly lipoprotein
MAVLTRRHILEMGVSVVLGGCGFRPVFGPQADAAGHIELGAIDVPILGGRSGQLLRQALVERIERAGGSSPKLYDLVVSYTSSAEGIATQRDSSISRYRMTGSATWVLVTQDVLRRTVAKGVARAADGYNPIGVQFFGTELEIEQVQRRMVEQVAEQLVLQLALAVPPKAGG